MLVDHFLRKDQKLKNKNTNIDTVMKEKSCQAQAYYGLYLQTGDSLHVDLHMKPGSCSCKARKIENGPGNL